MCGCVQVSIEILFLYGQSSQYNPLLVLIFWGSAPWAKTIKKNTNSIQNKSQTHRANQYEVTTFQSTYCELSTETCSKNVYSLGPMCILSVHTLLKVVSHYDLSVLSMSVMGFQKKV